MTEETGFAGLEGFDLTDTIQRGFTEEQIEAPTAVQRDGIAAILAGKQVVLHSGTGTGKTLAYLLPVMQRLRDATTGRTVVMTPATELAMQIARTANLYKEEALNVGTAVSSVKHGRQKSRITKSTRLIIGTPGRILELYAEKKLKGVTTMVLDEPDPILNSKGGDFLCEILRRPEPKVQLIMAGATLGPRAQALIAEKMGEERVYVEPGEDPLHENIAHHFVGVKGSMGKDVTLARFLDENRCERAIVFVNKGKVISHLYRYLNEHGHDTVTLSEERSQHQRKEAMRAMREGDAKVLVTTDAASRGLDFFDIPWVFHYDMPSSHHAYVHRAGRTGRAGKVGTSVAILTDKERSVLKRVTKELAITCTPFQRTKS